MLQAILSRDETDSADNENVDSEEERKMRKKWKINANGTWKSIVAWGKVANLDAEQQTAFEILASTFVLSFFSEAEADCAPSDELKKEEEALKKLARVKKNKGPMVMFVTGPAGAGKCKYKLCLNIYMTIF